MWYLIASSLAAGAYFTVPGLEGNGALFGAIGLSAAAAIVVGALRNRPRRMLPWMLFASAQVSFVIGDLLYYMFDAEFPSVGDAFYLAVYPLLVAGLLVLIRARSEGRDRGSLIDASVVTVGVGLLAWVFLIEPYTRLDGIDGFERIMSMAYPLMDVLLLAVAARLAIGAGVRPASFYLVGLGIVSLLATDAVYGYIELHNGYTQGGLLDAGWLAYYVLWGTAALLPGMRRIEEPSAQPRATLTGRRLVPLAAATLIAPGVAIIQSLARSESSLLVSAVASAVLFLLVLSRMTGLVNTLRRSVDEEQRALAREGVLRRAAVALGGAADRDAVEAVTLEAARALTAEAAGASPHAMDVRLHSESSAPGSIVVGEPGAVPASVRAALETLDAQYSMALERAELADGLLRRRSDERIAAIVQHASDVITVLDADLMVLHQTASVGSFLDYPAGALAGQSFPDLVHPDDQLRARAFLAALVTHGGIRPETEFRLRSGGGTWVEVEALGDNLLKDPRVEGIVVTIRDVSKRKALEEGLRLQVNELRELDRIKSELVSTVSHELRTPLTTVVGHVEMLTDGDLGELSADQRWAVGAIQRNCERLLTLIEDMLTLAKIENGGLGLDLVPTRVGAVLVEVEAAGASLAEARSINLTVELAGGTPDVLADASALERVLMNLLSNAVKFTPEGGAVHVRAGRDGSDVVFSVSDTGMGMSAEDKERLFTRFFRSPTAMAMAIPGTGLGLAIVKKIVDDHGGSIRVDSVPGTGTTVEFTIPTATAEAPVAGVAR
jgi:PAS domain S-box-containing protein